MATRRTFLGTSALALGAASTTAALGAATTPSGPYDFAAIAARLARPAPHRQVFGTSKLANANLLHYMLNALNAYQFDYGEGPGSLHAAGVCYGSAVALLVDDFAWQTYQLTSVQEKRADPVKLKTTATGNPYLAATSALDVRANRDDSHGLYHDESLTALVQRGASFFACNNALRGLATDIAVTYGTATAPVDVVLADLRRHLVPGALLVPAGDAAVNQAQEARFTLFVAAV
jgi:hypothetical protein